MRIGGSVTLLAIGAILAFAVNIDPTPAAGITIDWSAVGWILMGVGVLGLIWSAMIWSDIRNRNATTYVERDFVER